MRRYFPLLLRKAAIIFHGTVPDTPRSIPDVSSVPQVMHSLAEVESIGGRASAMVDLLRGFFAILVVVAHVYSAALPMSPEAGARSFRGYLEYTIGHAGLWVTGFFVISGFCIQMSIRNSWRRGRWSWRSYLLARFTRIYPLALAGLLLATAVWLVRARTSSPFPWRHWLGTWFMVQNFTGLFPHYVQSWSLTNETVYYLVWPLFLVANGFRSSRAQVWAAIALAVTTLVAGGVWKVAAGGRADHWLIPVWTTSASFVWWLSGVVLIDHWPALSRFATARRCAWLLPLSAIPCAGAFLISYLGARTLAGFATIYACIPMFGLLVLSGPHLAWLETPGGQRTASFFGLFSFPLYIFHVQVIDLVAPLLSRWRLPGGVVFTLVLTTVLAICCPLGAKLESHLLTLRKRLLTRG